MRQPDNSADRFKPGTTHQAVCGVCGRASVSCYSIPRIGMVCLDRCARKFRGWLGEKAA